MQVHKIAPATEIVQAKEQQSRGYSSWWTWRRSGSGVKLETDKTPSKERSEADLATGDKSTEPNHVATQVAGSDTSSDAKATLQNGTDNVLDLSDDGQSGELYRKSLRLTTSQIVRFIWNICCYVFLTINFFDYRKASTSRTAWTKYRSAWQPLTRAHRVASAICSGGDTTTKWWYQILMERSPSRTSSVTSCRWSVETGRKSVLLSCSPRLKRMATNCCIFQREPLASLEWVIYWMIMQ